MDSKLQLLFMAASIMTALFIVIQIRNSDLHIDDAIFWLLWSALLLFFSFFPGIIIWFSQLLGFVSPSNFVLVLFIFFLYIVVFRQNQQISRLKEKQADLVQTLSMTFFANVPQDQKEKAKDPADGTENKTRKQEAQSHTDEPSSRTTEKEPA